MRRDIVIDNKAFLVRAKKAFLASFCVKKSKLTQEGVNFYADQNP
ncbi:hypothetical protein SAMN03159341_103445 [Paenibacillus sp. 1_12]|nr:hypothetical protein SAMN03159341_103445 [Paenibacillus sp. 1_12]